MNKGLTKVVCGAWSTFFGQTVGKDSKDLTRGEPDDDSDIIPSRVHKGSKTFKLPLKLNDSIFAETFPSLPHENLHDHWEEKFISSMKEQSLHRKPFIRLNDLKLGGRTFWKDNFDALFASVQFHNLKGSTGRGSDGKLKHCSYAAALKHYIIHFRCILLTTSFEGIEPGIYVIHAKVVKTLIPVPAEQSSEKPSGKVSPSSWTWPWSPISKPSAQSDELDAFDFANEEERERFFALIIAVDEALQKSQAQEIPSPPPPPPPPPPPTHPSQQLPMVVSNQPAVKRHRSLTGVAAAPAKEDNLRYYGTGHFNSPHLRRVNTVNSVPDGKDLPTAPSTAASSRTVSKDNSSAVLPQQDLWDRSMVLSFQPPPLPPPSLSKFQTPADVAVPASPGTGKGKRKTYLRQDSLPKGVV